MLLATHDIAVIAGCIERPPTGAATASTPASVYIAADGRIRSVHRKLMPTYEERLTWSPGDGHGLRVHRLGAFTVGGLNCWENWMPLARAALYGQGEDLHVAVWPGSRAQHRGHHPLHRGGGALLCALGVRADAQERLPRQHAAPGRDPRRQRRCAGRRRLVHRRARRHVGGRSRSSARSG